MEMQIPSLDNTLQFDGRNVILLDFEEIADPNQNNQEYTILGKGNFGYTEKMKFKYFNEGGNIFAIKKLDITHIRENIKEQRSLKREIKLMEQLNHENIVNFIGYFYDQENINKYKEIYKEKKDIKEIYYKNIVCLVMEYLPNGTLEEYVKNFRKNNENENIPQAFVIKVFREILNGLMYLKSKQILHRDIKPANILFDQNYTAKISDFGISAVYNQKQKKNEEKKEDEDEENEKNEITVDDPDLYMNNSLVGDKNYVSNEITERKKYDFQVDVYSLGITIFYMMTGSLPCYSKIRTNSAKM